jgi:hypothetical protein
MNAPLIGLYSPVPGSGKSTLAQALGGYCFETVRFAGPLKQMLKILLLEAGCDVRELDRYVDGDLKEVETPFLGGRTPRHAMQTLGTEWGRKLMRTTFWLDLFHSKVSQLRAAGKPVVCDDMRFENEAEAIRSAGGILVRITRPSLPKAQPLVVGHVSEGALDHLEFDLEVTNDMPSAEHFATNWAPVVEAVAYGVVELCGRP